MTDDKMLAVVTQYIHEADAYIKQTRVTIANAREAIEAAKHKIVEQHARINRLRMGFQRIADSEQADPVSRALAMTSLKNDDKAAGE